MKEQSAYAKAILKDGYTIAKSAIKEEVLEKINRWHINHTIIQQKYGRKNKFHGEASVVNNLQSEELFFWDLISDPLINQVCDELLNAYSYNNNEGYTLLGSAIRSIEGPQKAQQLHIDSSLPGSNHVLSLQFCIPLTSFDKESGSTQVVIGSHNKKEYPPSGNKLNSEDSSQLRVLEAKPGDLIMFDSGIWHGSSQKLNNKVRSAVFIRYGRWFLKQSYDIANNIPMDIYKNLNENQLKLAGAYFQPPLDDSENRGRKSDTPILRTYQ